MNVFNISADMKMEVKSESLAHEHTELPILS